MGARLRGERPGQRVSGSGAQTEAGRAGSPRRGSGQWFGRADRGGEGVLRRGHREVPSVFKAHVSNHA